MTDNLLKRIERMEAELTTLREFIGLTNGETNGTPKTKAFTVSYDERKQEAKLTEIDKATLTEPALHGWVICAYPIDRESDDACVYYGGIRNGRSRWVKSLTVAVRFDGSSAAKTYAKGLDRPSATYDKPRAIPKHEASKK